MPRLATIAIHAVAVAVLGVLAYKLLLEPDGNGGVSGVRGGQIVQEADEGSKPADRPPERGRPSRDSDSETGSRAAAPPQTVVAVAPPGAEPITTTRTTRDVVRDPTADQYGDRLSVIESKLTSTTFRPADPSSGTASGSRLLSALPFTGTDLIGLGALAVAMFSAGWALRRLDPTH